MTGTGDLQTIAKGGLATRYFQKRTFAMPYVTSTSQRAGLLWTSDFCAVCGEAARA